MAKVVNCNSRAFCKIQNNNAGTLRVESWTPGGWETVEAQSPSQRPVEFSVVPSLETHHRHFQCAGHGGWRDNGPRLPAGGATHPRTCPLRLPRTLLLEPRRTRCRLAPPRLCLLERHWWGWAGFSAALTWGRANFGLETVFFKDCLKVRVAKQMP